MITEKRLKVLININKTTKRELLRKLKTTLSFIVQATIELKEKNLIECEKIDNRGNWLVLTKKGELAKEHALALMELYKC